MKKLLFLVAVVTMAFCGIRECQIYIGIVIVANIMEYLTGDATKR